MTPEQIAQGLIRFYSTRGIDLHLLLKDPIFDKLPISEKIMAIKAHATQMAAGTSTGISRGDLKDMAVDLGVGAAIGTGMAAQGTLAHMALGGKITPMGALAVLPMIVASGAVMNLVANGGKYMSRIQDRSLLRRTLLNAAIKKDDYSALSVLATNSVGSVTGSEKLTDKLFDASGIAKKTDPSNLAEVAKDNLGYYHPIEN